MGRQIEREEGRKRRCDEDEIEDAIGFEEIMRCVYVGIREKDQLRESQVGWLKMSKITEQGQDGIKEKVEVGEPN